MDGAIAFHDGASIRWADALQAWRSLERDLRDPEQALFALDNAPPDEALSAEAALIAAARKAFRLQPLDMATGSGVSDLAAKRLAIELIRRSRGA